MSCGRVGVSLRRGGGGGGAAGALIRCLPELRHTHTHTPAIVEGVMEDAWFD